MDKITILNNELYLSDIERAVNSFNLIDFPKNKTILITGATGLICSTVVDLMVCLYNHFGLNLKIIIAVRNIEKAKLRFSKYLNNSNVSFLHYDAMNPCEFPNNIDYIIHGANNAYPALYSSNPVETLLAGMKGLESILRYSVNNSTRVLYISSSEIYGQLENKDPIKETDIGSVDILNPRSAYAMGKRASETMCSSFNTEYNCDSVIVRPGHVYGPTASVQDNRVSSTFMYLAAQGNDLVMKSTGEQIRSYCYCIDCASAIITVLLKGIKGEAYNISNKNSICSIKDMAEIFACAGNVNLNFSLPSEKEKKAFNPMLNSSLNSEKLESLGWNPVFSMKEGFEHSVVICKDLIK